MSLKLDRNVLQWFDYVFENEKLVWDTIILIVH